PLALPRLLALRVASFETTTSTAPRLAAPCLSRYAWLAPHVSRRVEDIVGVDRLASWSWQGGLSSWWASLLRGASCYPNESHGASSFVAQRPLHSDKTQQYSPMSRGSIVAAFGRWRARLHLIMLIATLLFVTASCLSVENLSYRPARKHRPTCLATITPCEVRGRLKRRSPQSPNWTMLRQTSPTVGDGDHNDAQLSSNKSPSRIRKLFQKDLSVPAILLAAFLNLLGFTMASPIQPALGKHFSLPLGASFGSLSSAYPLGMMLGVFLWPTLSDILGRKIVMSLTLMGSGLGLMLQSWGIRRSWTLEQFLAARVLTGCFAGNSPISKAYLADRGSEAGKDELTKYLAWKDAASTLAFIAGPALGGFVYQLFGSGAVGNNSGQLSFVIFSSAMASLFASISVLLFVKNTGGRGKTNAATTNQEPSKNGIDSRDKIEDQNKASTEIMACPLGSKLWTGVASVACVSALYHAADSTFFAFFPSLLQNKLKFDTRAVGMTFTSLAVVSFTGSAFISSKILRAFGPVAACTAGLGAVGTGLMTIGYAASSSVSLTITSAFILGASALYYTGVPLYGPSVPMMLLQCVPPHRRGAVMGFDGAVNTLARVVSPLIMGEILRVKGAGSCFKVAGSCAFAAASMALFRRWLVLRKVFANSELNSE
ncbi:hypothetical protein ACHAWF_012197, partial [Thalassiosira exigua]